MQPGHLVHDVHGGRALLAGVGGGNFASSMTNINAFFPLRKKGWALGLNAGGGNIGVPVIQLVAPAGHRDGRRRRTRGSCSAIYIPLIVVAAVLRRAFMDNICVGAQRHRRRSRRRSGTRHTWIMSFLYIGTFGSFIGYSFAFGLVLQNQFGRTPLQAASITFIGPLLGSLIRPVGGRLADRYGGARDHARGTSSAMAAATGGRRHRPRHAKSLRCSTRSASSSCSC